MAEDLSTRHEPVGNLLETPLADTSPFQLTPDQVAFFHENGYLTGIPLLDDRQIEILREELQQISDPNHPSHEFFYEFHSNESVDPSQVLFHALGAWRTTPGLHDLLWHPGFTVPASQLLDGAVRFWHDQLFVKPPHHGGVVAWHQDYSYWTRTKPVAHLSCWIALDDSTRENGCIHYVPGSHQWDLLPITGLAGDMHAIDDVLDEQQKQAFRPVPIELKAGQCAIHHSLLVHGSYENRSDRPRRAIVLNVLRDGVISDSDEPLLLGVPPIPRKQKIEGQFFPLLYSPENESPA